MGWLEVRSGAGELVILCWPDLLRYESTDEQIVGNVDRRGIRGLRQCASQARHSRFRRCPLWRRGVRSAQLSRRERQLANDRFVGRFGQSRG